MLRRSFRLVSAAVFLLAAAAPALAQLTARVVVSGLTNPVAMVVDPLDASTFFIVEQRGVVQVVRDGQILPTPFLDLRDAVVSGGEQGLLGMAIEPDGACVFVNFTNREGDTVIARFRRSADDPRVADLSSRRDLIWPDGRAFIDQPFANHNGGHLVFGPDGYLYVGLGDGGSGGDPMHFAQDPHSLLGKMLRLDVSVADEDPRGYRVPADNPFVDGDPVPAHGEIWAFGLRNPWRYAFDDPGRGGSGALIIADVGQSAREEVNYQPPGAGGLNYGWRLREGTMGFDDRRPAAYGPLTDPIHEYGRNEGQSITGGYVYRGAALDSSFAGRYFFADFVAGRVFSLALDQTAGATAIATDVRDHTDAIGAGRSALFSSFGIDADGELYVLNYAAGTVLKIVPDLTSVPGVPEGARMTVERGIAEIAWSAPRRGADSIGYLLETTTREGGPTLRSVRLGRRMRVRVRLSSEEPCVRVRALGRDAMSAPTPALCASSP